MNYKFAERKLADINTSHIQKQDGLLIQSSNLPGRVAESDPVDHGVKSGPGVWIAIPDYKDAIEDHVKRLLAFGMSGAYVELVRQLSEEGFAYANLDRDGEIVAGAPVFDW